MKQTVFCVLMLMLECVVSDSETFLIKHAAGGKFFHPQGGSSNPSDGTYIVLHSDVHNRMYWTFEHAFDHWGYIKHVCSGKVIHPKGGNIYSGDGTYLLVHGDRHWGALFAFDAVNDHVIHKCGRYAHPKGGATNPGDGTYVVLHSDAHDNMKWKFVSVTDQTKEVPVYGLPKMAGKWKIINMVRNAIAEHTLTLQVKVGRSKTQSVTTSFQYTWETSDGAEIKAFSASVSQSFQFMVERTSSSTWSEETTHTRTILVSPGMTVVTWQYVIYVEQNASKSVFQSDLLADTDSETKVPEDVQYTI